MYKLILMTLFFVFVKATKPMLQTNTKSEKINITISGFGKTNLSATYLSKITGLNRRNFTSSFYYGKSQSMPINDNHFNYDYFNTKYYTNLRNGKSIQAVLFYKRYKYKNSIICIADSIK